jgi:hypothetical protein
MVLHLVFDFLDRSFDSLFNAMSASAPPNCYLPFVTSAPLGHQVYLSLAFSNFFRFAAPRAESRGALQQ